MSDVLVVGLIIGLMPLAIIGVISIALSFFVALRSPPSQRAGWTVGIAYVVTTTILVFGGIEGFEFWAPLAGVPGGLVAFWYWRMSFRRAWTNDPELIADGTTIEDDDWRIGLLRLMILVVLAIGVWVVRLVLRGF